MYEVEHRGILIPVHQVESIMAAIEAQGKEGWRFCGGVLLHVNSQPGGIFMPAPSQPQPMLLAIFARPKLPTNGKSEPPPPGLLAN